MMSHAVSFAAEDFTEGFQVHDCLLWMCGDSVLDCLKLEIIIHLFQGLNRFYYSHTDRTQMVYFS